MNYKDPTEVRPFLSDEEINETKNKIFFNFELPSVKDKLDVIFDYLKKDWMEYIFNLPISTPVFFDLVQNGKYHSYKATPEKIQTILKCLESRNWCSHTRWYFLNAVGKLFVFF